MGRLNSSSSKSGRRSWREAKVNQNRFTAGAEHDVAGFDVQMHHVLFVQSVQRKRCLVPNVGDFVYGQWSLVEAGRSDSP